MRRFFDYYRQFEELSQEEITAELLERRDAEQARALAEVPRLNLTSPAWHEPPDPEAVNAATYALRRAVNAYPDAAPLREALAERHGVEPAQVAAGHGAGELLHAMFGAIAGGGQVARLVDQAGGVPVPVAPGADALLAAAAGPDTHAIVVCTPNDPTGAAIELGGPAERLPEAVWLVVDAALAEFAPGDSRLSSLLAARERVVVVRSFSKAHAMAGFRVGFAVANDAELLDRIAPVGGVSAPAQAAALWAVRSGDAVVRRRRAAAARERERLAAGLEGTPFSFVAGHGPLVWLSSSEHDGRTIASGLAAQRIYVTPGAAWGDDRHVRVALRDGAATDRLVTTLREL